MNVLVLGATGFVGTELVPALLEAGHRVRALSRNPSAVEATANAEVEVVEGNVLEPASLEGVFDDIDVVYYLIHSLDAGSDFARRDRQAAETVASLASDAGVARMIYLGGLGGTGDVLSEHLLSRREVETVLAAGSYELTTLRAAIIIGTDSASFDLIYQLAAKLPLMITPRWVRTACQPIAIDDVIAYLVSVLEVPETAGEVLEIGGPEVLSYEQLLKRTAAQLGGRLVIIPVPVLSPQLSVYWVDFVTDIPADVVHPLIHGLKNPVVVTDDRVRSLVPLELTPIDEAITEAIAGLSQ